MTARWNAWADKNKMTDYTAFIATPFLHSADNQNDVLWIGAWPNGAAMARDSALSATKEGRDIDTAYDAVGKCASHALYAEVLIRQPKNPPPENAHYTFKHVVGYGSMDAFGKDVDVYTAGGFRRVDELLERILDCNSPRV